jgi:hypothetical protein
MISGKPWDAGLFRAKRNRRLERRKMEGKRCFILVEGSWVDSFE